jgi:hypothetical protein
LIQRGTGKVKAVEVKVGDHLETRRLERLPAQVRQGLVWIERGYL